jgi:hypothetical protein
VRNLRFMHSPEWLVAPDKHGKPKGEHLRFGSGRRLFQLKLSKVSVVMRAHCRLPIFFLPVILMLNFVTGAGASTAIPFVGCSSDGIFGKMGAAKGKSLLADIPKNIAVKLAIYADSQGMLAVLAPRGWSCTSWLANSSARMTILSDPKTPSGPAVSISESGVAGGADWAYYFPKLYPNLPHATPWEASNDVLQVRSPTVVDYVTPAHHFGLGFDPYVSSPPLPNLASYGLLAVNAAPDTGAFVISVRLPEKDSYLRAPIINFFARCLNAGATIQCESGGAFIANGSVPSN